jgi:hypothetical protein
VLDVRGRHPSSALPHAKRAEYEAGLMASVTQTKVLDGGWITWQEERRPISDEPVDLRPARFSARPRSRLRRTLADVREARARGAALVDARPRQELVDGATGLWAAPAAVARLARAAGIDPDGPAGADRDLRQRRLGNGRTAVPGTDRDPHGRRLRRLVQRVERRRGPADRVRIAPSAVQARNRYGSTSPRRIA